MTTSTSTVMTVVVVEPPEPPSLLEVDRSGTSVGEAVGSPLVGDTVGLRVGHQPGTCWPPASTTSSGGINAAARYSCRRSSGIVLFFRPRFNLANLLFWSAN